MGTMGLPEKLLQALDDKSKLDTYEFATLINEDHQKVVGAVKCLQALDEVITVQPKSSVKWVLTQEGKDVANVGSHEALAYEAIPSEGISKDDLSKNVPAAVHTIGLSKAMACGWILVEKIEGKTILRRKVDVIKDIVKEQLLAFAINPDIIDAKVRNEYKKRKLIQEVTTTSFILSKGKNFSLRVSKLETDLTAEMIASGSWKNLDFKSYNFNAQGVPLPCGVLHPLLKVRAEFRQIFLEMGFTEMPTNNYVESSFWNFDALFQPQQHPARDAHDTFFVEAPKETTTFPMPYLEKVKQVHSYGGFGSQGYGYEWKIEEAKKNLLRTHTTAVSAKMLYQLAQNDFRPAKYFSIDRVFRNETLDATHLAEFHQVEGVVADYNLSLGDLIGILNEFFSKLGLSNLTFKPAYNPYTEPSMEIFSFHPGLNKYIEVGNSGIFRPEMLLPMGFPENVNVIAWGLSLERPTMIKYAINNIRTLVGPKVDMEMVHASPICRLDKVDKCVCDPEMELLVERLDMAIVALEGINHSEIVHNVKEMNESPEACPQVVEENVGEIVQVPQASTLVEKQNVCKKLEAPQTSLPIKIQSDETLHISSHVEMQNDALLQASFGESEQKICKVMEDIIIVANPQYPPWSLIVLLKLLANKINGTIDMDCRHDTMSKDVYCLVENIFESGDSTTKQLSVRFVLKNNVNHFMKVIKSKLLLLGEVNIARYLAVWIEKENNSPAIYKKVPIDDSCEIDYWLDLIHSSLVYGSGEKREYAFMKLDTLLKRNLWIVGYKPTIADFCCWSVLRNMPSLPVVLQLWLEVCDEYEMFFLN